MTDKTRGIALEEILGPKMADRLSALSTSWGTSIGQTLRNAVEYMPEKTKWDRAIALAESNRRQLVQLLARDPHRVAGMLNQFDECCDTWKFPMRARVVSN